MAGFADYLKLSSAMGALIAGVMISTFPYTLDVVAKVTSLRDFFVTLFFVGLGMKIPVPDGGLHFVDAVRLPRAHRQPPRHGFSRAVFPAPGLPRQLAAGGQSVPDERIVAGAARPRPEQRRCLGQRHRHRGVRFLLPRHRFHLCASSATIRCSAKSRRCCARLGLHDLDHTAFLARADAAPRRICLLGFYWTASSLLAEIERHRPDLLPEICVIDFNPVVHEKLKAPQRLSPSMATSPRATCCIMPAWRTPKSSSARCRTRCSKGANNLKILRQIARIESPRANHRPCGTAGGCARALCGRRQLRHRAAPAGSRRPVARAGIGRRKTRSTTSASEQEMLLKERGEVIP